MYRINAWGRTDAGRVRSKNQDAFLVKPHKNGMLLVVADGMGGGVAGEVASHMVIDELESAFTPDPFNSDLACRLLEMALYRVHLKIREEALIKYGGAQMATTCTAVWLADDGHVSMAHVGDSRLYHVQDGILAQRSHDHTIVAELIRGGMLTDEQAMVHPHRHILSRSVGGNDLLSLDPLQLFKLNKGDALLLCSDGLDRHLNIKEISELGRREGCGQRFVDSLIEEANRRGGHDNITAVLAVYGKWCGLRKPRPLRSMPGAFLETASQSH